MTGKLKIILIYLLSIGILVSVGVYGYRSSDQYRNASDWVNHTAEVIGETQEILINIQSIESSQRGYVITGDDKYLEYYELGIKNYAVSFLKVKALTKVNATQLALLDSIQPIIESKIAFVRKVVKERKEHGYDAAQKLVTTDVGEKLMKEIRSSVNQFISNEKSFLSEKLATAKSNFSLTQNIIVTSILLTVAILLLALYFFVKDHNRRILSEKNLIEAKKMAEESSILKEAFLANMSHEIRTPMNAILGFTNLLLKKRLGEQERDYITTIKSSGETLLKIINDVLDVSKIESGTMVFEEQLLSIPEMFSSINNMLFARAAEKKIQLTFTCDSSVPGTLMGDPTRLTQILINLVGNAIKFTERGIIEISARTNKKQEDLFFIEFSIKDSGIGIAADKLEVIFERFRQAESHTTRNYGGTGLGLNIAKQLVELQGGEIHVKSQLGVGTIFTFLLPFKKSNEISNIRDEQKSELLLDMKELRNKKILLVEDNPVNVKFIQSLFNGFLIKADLAENGKIAVEKVKATAYDIILMDIEMPEMNGYEATAIIRTELKSMVPIIAMTAHAMAGESEKCLRAGMNAYISKPVNEELLFEKMFSLSSGKTPDKKDTEIIKSKIVNLDFLIKTMRGKKEVIRETIDIYLVQMKEDAAFLESAVKEMDYSMIKRYSHRMKSTVSLMGITEIEEILEELELLSTEKKEEEKIRTLHSSFVILKQQADEEVRSEKTNYI
ncbi:hypothetical protein BH11BAC7_BH11BAC7_04210 [soil metagenome]